MNRQAPFVTIVVAISLMAVALAFGETPQVPTDYTIRVTSMTPGKEVRFEAAMLFRNAEAPLQTVTRRTPFEMRSTGAAASALFRARGDRTIQVELVGEQAGKEISRSSATGRAVVVGNNLLQDSSGFITSF